MVQFLQVAIDFLLCHLQSKTLKTRVKIDKLGNTAIQTYLFASGVISVSAPIEPVRVIGIISVYFFKNNFVLHISNSWKIVSVCCVYM